MNGSKILTVSAHPDDWELGAGGTMRRLEREGSKIEHLIIGGGRGDEYDNQFDKLPLLHWVSIIEHCIDRIKPDIIFTHYEKDLNVDHRITYQAVITAARPMPDCCVREIYSFEVLSSTEWSFPTSFSPDVFWEIAHQDICYKTVIMDGKYKEELREFPHPRSVIGIKILAQYRGMQCGVEFAEAFKTVRRII